MSDDFEFNICFLADDAEHADRITTKWLQRIDRHHWWAFWRRNKCEWECAFGPSLLPPGDDASEIIRLEGELRRLRGAAASVTKGTLNG